MKVAAACLPLSNGSFLDFKTEPTHCNHIRTAKHKIDQISSAIVIGIMPCPKLSMRLDKWSSREQEGRPRQPRPAFLR